MNQNSKWASHQQLKVKRVQPVAVVEKPAKKEPEPVVETTKFEVEQTPEVEVNVPELKPIAKKTKKD